MTRRFVVDANLPIALARQIAGDGFDCVHVLDLGNLAIADSEIWSLADAQSRTIISRDGDFATFALVRPSGPAVVWVRMGNVRKRVLLDRFRRDFPKVIALLDAGDRLIEVR